MLGIPEGSKKNWYGFSGTAPMDKESKDEFEFPGRVHVQGGAQGPSTRASTPSAPCSAEMDHFGIDKAMVGVNFERSVSVDAVKRHPDRFIGSYEVNAQRGMDGRARADAGRRGARRAGRPPPSPPA